MSGWNGTAIVSYAPKPIESHPGWWDVDCHCCGGLSWGGEYPRECPDCHGSGGIIIHRKSGIMADYPGGPLRGRADASLLAEIDGVKA